MAQCLSPFLVKQKGEESIPVPCGKCPSCLARRASAWSFRLIQEERQSQSAHFITLTYDSNHVPITSRGFMDLSKRDVQLFFKRLRKAQSAVTSDHPPIRYFACGEYGTKSKRPHYHILIFNAKLELIQPAWDLGYIYYGQVTGASVGYTLKYMSKPGRIPMHKNDDRQPEFQLMSKGLGSSYLTQAMKAWHLADNSRMYLTTIDGKKISMPRYYKDKIYDQDQREIVGREALARLIEARNKSIEKAGSAEIYDQAFERAKKVKYDRMYKKSTEKRNKN